MYIIIGKIFDGFGCWNPNRGSLSDRISKECEFNSYKEANKECKQLLKESPDMDICPFEIDDMYFPPELSLITKKEELTFTLTRYQRVKRIKEHLK